MTLRQVAGWFSLGVIAFVVPVAIEAALRIGPRWSEIPPGNVATLPNAWVFAVAGCVLCLGVALLTRRPGTASSLWAIRLWLAFGAFGSFWAVGFWLSMAYDAIDLPGPQEGSAVTLLFAIAGPILAIGAFVFLVASTLRMPRGKLLAGGEFE
ncbi:hypothetical protein ACIQTT_12500 [Microbacterium sp. NPDC090225]|uniref:hypothetical protein n=1 Tax=Microbacterium sp. NPDC090225 TaxID=3364207 RepID=UPI0037FE0277